jgi:hypothetical protein
MREVAHALDDVDIQPITALATAKRQGWLVAEMAKKQIHFDANKPFSWRSLADAVVRRRRRSSLRNHK